MERINTTRNQFIRRFFFFALALTSVILTSIFFLTHLRFAWLEQQSALLHAAFVLLLGLVSADVGALVWRRIWLHGCESAAQVIIAQAMMTLTLLMAALTTLGGMAEARIGGSILPPSADEWISWATMLTLSAEFIAGAFLFDVFNPFNTVRRELIAATATDAADVASEVALRLRDGRESRVAALSAEISRAGDAAILETLSINRRDLDDAPRSHPVATPAPHRAVATIRPNPNGHATAAGGSARFHQNGTK